MTLFAGDVLQLSVFAVLAFWAFSARRDGATHKRLILLATAALMGPALARWPFPFVFSSYLIFFGILDSFWIFMMAFDLWTRRRVHFATICGAALIVAMQVSMRPLGHSAVWHQFTAWVQRV
jgi:hypothetical protein